MNALVTFTTNTDPMMSPQRDSIFFDRTMAYVDITIIREYIITNPHDVSQMDLYVGLENHPPGSTTCSTFLPSWDGNKIIQAIAAMMEDSKANQAGSDSEGAAETGLLGNG
jgi:hypothetical protein